MGTGNTGSFRWEEDRKHTPEERINYWKDKATQSQSRVFFLDKDNQKLAKTIAERDRQLAEYRQCFGPIMFSTPQVNENGEDS